MTLNELYVSSSDDGGWGPEEISLLVSASEGHSQRNLRRSRAEQGEG